MEFVPKTILFTLALCVCASIGDSAKINTPRVLLPWFEDVNVNFTFEIHEGGCYTWSLSRDDIIDLEPLYEDTWAHCSRAARVSVSKACVPPGSVIILAEEVNTGEILRGDVNIDKISSLKVMSTTWKLYLEEAPEAFEVFAYDELGNKFSTLEGVAFKWTIENLGSNVYEDPLVTLVRWRDTDYEAPPGISELEALGLRSHSVLLYGQAMGECRVTVCLHDICTDFDLHVVASVVLTPATALIAPGDTLRYKVVRARAGRLTIQDIADTLYYMKLPDTDIAVIEDTISLVRASKIGSTSVFLMSGATEVATATLTVVEPHSIRVSLRPSNLVIQGEQFIVHCIVLDAEGHPLTAGNEILIRLSVDGVANVDLLRSTENGTITDAIAHNAGPFTVTAKLHSIAGKILSSKVEGEVSGVAVEPLEIVPPELYVAWTDTVQEIQLKHRGGGEEIVMWAEAGVSSNRDITLTPGGVATVRGTGELDVRVQLKKYPHIQAAGRVIVGVPEWVQVSSSGHARVLRPHRLHVALTATHPTTGELYNYHICNCASFAVTLLEGPEPQNVTAAPWLEPVEGACCVLQCVWLSRGVSAVRVSRGRAGDTARVAVRAAPRLVWPEHVAALPSATLPVLAEGEALVPQSSEPRIAELTTRDELPPHRYPDVQLFTFRCFRKGDSRLYLTSRTEDEQESVEFEAACAPHVSRVRLEPSETPGNCSGGPRVWLRPGSEVTLKVTLFDAIGRELLDENGPSVSWETEPYHAGIEYKTNDRLFVETHPEYAPVPVPYKYYQLVMANEQAIGWKGMLKASIPDATASIQARVVAPLKCEPLKVNVAWEGETVSNIALVSGGSGRYGTEAPSGVSAAVVGGQLSATAPGPGAYSVAVTDLCVHGERQIVEVVIEEVMTVEVESARAIGVGACVTVSATGRGADGSPLSASGAPRWRVTGPAELRRDNQLCGTAAGTAIIRASIAGVWSPDLEVLVFPPLQIVPEKSRLPPGARLQLRHHGGPPPHLATLHYRAISRHHYIEVSPTGIVHGLSKGLALVQLVAKDIANVEMASAEAEVEVVSITGLRVESATPTLVVGSAGSLRVVGEALPAVALSALQPPPRVLWALRDPNAARLYATHIDDMLERQMAEGLSVRVVPLKPGVITIDVRVRNMGQAAETRSWDSTVEILAVADIKTSVEGLPDQLASGERLSIAVGSTLKLKSLPRSSWKGYGDGAFEISADGELKALKPGHGVVIAYHNDERNHIYRETAMHVEVSTPVYCTAQPTADGEDSSVRLVLRNSLGRPLLAPDVNVSAIAPLSAYVRRSVHSALGNELVITGLEPSGAFMSFECSLGGVTMRDDVWVTGPDTRSDKILATGGWGVCLEGVGWRASPGVQVYSGSGVSLAVLARTAPAKHTLRLDRPYTTVTVHQLPIHKMEFAPGDWPAALVPLSIEATGLTSGPLLCTEDQKYALEGVEVELPITCRTKAPYKAHAVLDIIKGELGCSITPSSPTIEASDVELCAEWEMARTCTRVKLLPPIRVSHDKVSLLQPPTTFTVYGNPEALRLVKMSPSPGLKLESRTKDNEINVIVKNEASTLCGHGWVTVRSRLTAQEIRVEVERDCDAACGTLLGAIFSLFRPYLSTLVTVAVIGATFLFIQSKLQQKGQIRMPTDPSQTTLPPVTPQVNRSRTWSRSPYSTRGPSAPVYGDASVLPDQSFSPNSTRMHSSFPAFGL